MAATFAAFRAVNAVQAPRGRTRWIQLGWLYLDTIAILQKLTALPAEDYLHHADVHDLDGLRELLAAHSGHVAGIFAEVPTNPLIQTPALATLAALCRAHGVALVVDPTIASPLNIDVLPHADVVVNSLTKYTASEGDVILGAAALNPASPLAPSLRPALGAAAALASVYDRLRIAKGPSFGLTTSLVCPFMYLAHYDLVTTPGGRALLAKNGISPDLLRLGIGAEPVEEILAALAEALA
jgi:cystathionine gamma-synthase